MEKMIEKIKEIAKMIGLVIHKGLSTMFAVY